MSASPPLPPSTTSSSRKRAQWSERCNPRVQPISQLSSSSSSTSAILQPPQKVTTTEKVTRSSNFVGVPLEIEPEQVLASKAKNVIEDSLMQYYEYHKYSTITLSVFK